MSIENKEPIPWKEDCPCKKVECPRHGNCRACVENHKDKELLPACLRHFMEK